MLFRAIRSDHARPTGKNRSFAVALCAAAYTSLLGHSTSQAVLKTVCASGCDYSTIDSAVKNTPFGPGVTIQVSGGPYLEQVNIGNRDGASNNRAIIMAVGEVIIDGADNFTGTGNWSLYNGNVYNRAPLEIPC